MRHNSTFSRRQFLKGASSALLGALAAGVPRQLLAAGTEMPKPTADRLIILWMAGGMAHTETFDPKPPVAFEKGLDSRKLLSTFESIPSAIDGVHISSGLEHIAAVMDRGALIRSMVFEDLGAVLHTRHQFHWHTGYVPPITVAAPHLGSVLAKTRGGINQDLPAFVHVGQKSPTREKAALDAFMTAGFLGTEFGPLIIPTADEAARIMGKPTGMSGARFRARDDLYQALLKSSPFGEFGSDYQKESLFRSTQAAERLISSDSSKAFDISLEPDAVRQKYDTGDFGRGCLLARRLIEAGARVVEVTSEYIPFGKWDTHALGHSRTIALKQMIDRPIAQLILDLEERGLLDRTLVVIASEFSRVAGRNPGNKGKDTDITINQARQFGLHRHFIGGGSVALFGGGVTRGTVYGATRDEFPCDSVERPVPIADLHATIYRALGIPADLSFEIEQRPFYVTRDGMGEPIEELLT